MKCDKLKTYNAVVTDECGDYICGQEQLSFEAYAAEDVDAYIAELKRENERLVKCCKEYDSRQRIDEQIKFNGAQQLRATKRALWMARAMRAKTEYQHWILIWRCANTNQYFFINKTRYRHTSKVDRMRYPWEWRDIWILVEQRCLKKAEEYK